MTLSEHIEDIPPAIGCLFDRSFDRSGPMGQVLDYGMAYLFIDSHFARRIKNALELTSHAESISNTAVVLSFYVSGLEALLCSKDKHAKNSHQLKTRIPPLLQADQELAGDSGDAIEMLYKVRNQCVHGQDVSSVHEVSAVQRLFAAVLRGALEWAVQNGKSPDHTDDREWIMILKAEAANPERIGYVPGVTKQLSEHLQAFTTVFGRDRLKDLFDEVSDE